MYAELVDLCLSTIVNNFSKYNLAYQSESNQNQKRKFEFLQRKYSFEIISRLIAKGESLEEYIDLLINKYLKVLYAVWFKNCSWDKVTSKLAEIGPNIEKIFFQDVYFEEICREAPWQDIIRFLPNLRSFTFRKDCHDLIIKKVAKFCPNIEEIDFQFSAVTIEAVKNFCRSENSKAHCTKLKKLCILDSNIGEDGVKYILKNLPSLEEIDHPELPIVLYSLHKNDLSSLDKVEPYNISTLNITCAHYPFFFDLLKVCLSVCPRLKSLTCCLTNKDELNCFLYLPDLEHLNIENISNSEININSLLKSKGKKLNSLTITNCTVSLSVLAVSCPHVKELVLNEVHFLFDDNQNPVFSSLSSCTLVCSNDSPSAKAVGLLLLSSTKLESLSFKRCNLLSSEIKAHILKCCELNPIKEISFYYCLIEKEYIKDLLLDCHTLNYLNIHGSFHSDDEHELLKFAEILSNKPKINIGVHFNIRIQESDDVNYDYDSDDCDYYEDSDVCDYYDDPDDCDD